MVGSNVFVMKPKHQYHLCQWEECVYGAQSWKERRLSCESMIIPIDKWTLILKKGGKSSFSYEIKATIHLPNEEYYFMAHNH